MTNSFFRTLLGYFLVFIGIVLVLCLFLVPFLFSNASSVSFPSYTLSPNGFAWPLPGYTRISSAFGKRSSPTAGASSYHSGIDIPAPEGSCIVSICDGSVTFASWGAGGGYTVVVQNGSMSVSYCHVSPQFLVTRHQHVSTGEVIAYVGPKNVYGIANNPYTDSQGRPTNGATTGCHLHVTIKVDGSAVDPLSYLCIPTS